MGYTADTKTGPLSVAIVPLVGELDLSGCESLNVALAKAAIRAPNVIVDLSRCSFIDCTVIRLLIDAQNVVARNQGSFGVALPAEPNAVTRIAELVQLSQRVPTYSSVAAAIERLHREMSRVAGVTSDESPGTPRAARRDGSGYMELHDELRQRGA